MCGGSTLARASASDRRPPAALMALAPRLELRQNQSLVMTPQLQQAIKLLQMSQPRARRLPRRRGREEPAARAGAAGRAGGSASAGGGDPARRERRQLPRHAGGGDLALRAPARADRRDARAIRSDRGGADPRRRARGRRLPAGAARRGRGRATGCGPRLAAAGLALVQACDPAGVGARNLRECLALQLRERDRLDPAMQAMLDNLGAGGAAAGCAELEARCGVDAEDVADMLAELRALDPKPGLRFAIAPVQVAVPDVYVRAGAGRQLDGGAQHRDAAAGARQQRLRGAAEARRRRGARLRLRVQRRRRAGWCAASSSGRGPSSRSRPRSSRARSGS